MKNTSRNSLLFLLIISSLFSSLCVKAQWTTAYHGAGQNDPVTGMSFWTPAAGYIAFQNFVGYTADSGRDITPNYITTSNVNYNGYSVNLTFGFVMQGVHAFSKDSVFVYGNYGTEPTILFSSNGAQTWTVVFHEPVRFSASVPNAGVTDMCFPGNGGLGFAVHDDEVLTTTNRGQSWIVALSALNGQLQKLSFPDGNDGYVSGGEAAYKTADGGHTWLALSPPNGQTWDYMQTASGISGLFSFMTAQSGYLHTPADGSIYRTDDGAATWTKMNDPSVIPVSGQVLAFTNDSTGYVGSSPYSIWVTTDRGKTWEPAQGSNTYTDLGWGLGSLYFYNSQYGWAGGHDEFLLFTDNTGTATIPQAYFKADTTGVAVTGTVKLHDLSKANYTYRWIVNGAQVATTYSATYMHNVNRAKDTVELIVKNGSYSDTNVQVLNIPVPVVTPPPTYTGWSVIATGLADNLRDVRFWSPDGIVLGAQGLYYTTTGGVGAASWTKFVITGNSSDSLRLVHCRFEQMASQTAGQVYVAGTDTVANQAVLFFFNMNNLSYVWKYIGGAGTNFHSVAITQGLDICTAVGDNGLILAHTISSAGNGYLNVQTTQNLHEVEPINNLGEISIMGDSTIWTGDPRPASYGANSRSSYNMPSAYHFTSIAYVNTMGDIGITPAICYMPLFSAPITQVNSTGLVFNHISAGYTNNADFIATNRGIYRVYASNFGIGSSDIEYQYTSGTAPVNRIWMNEGYQSQVGYAVGPNGLLMATSNLGGPTVPYVSIGANVVGGCTGSAVTLSGYSGTGTACAWYLDNSLISSNCSDQLTISKPGAHTLSYVSSNAGLSDTAEKTITMVSPAAINLPVVLSDSILCGPSNITLQISNTQNEVYYHLKRKSDTTTYGTVVGNGGQVFMNSGVLTQAGTYYISASGPADACPSDFTDTFHIIFGQIHSTVYAGEVNAAAGDGVSYFQQSSGAQYYQWQFGSDASPSTSADPNPHNIVYSSPGQKSVVLVSSNESGCADTVTVPGVTIYQPSPDSCFALNLDGQDYYDEYYQQVNFGQAAYIKGGYLLSGAGLNQVYHSRQGQPYGPVPFGGLSLAKYSTDGVFRWAVYSRQPDFTTSNTNIKDVVNGVVSDANGNIYITGGATNASVFYFPNGDSLLLTQGKVQQPLYSGFIAKLDSNGVLLWKAVFEDNTTAYNGVNPSLVYGTRIVVRPTGDLVLSGGFGGNLAFYDAQGTATTLFTLNSGNSTVVPTRNFLMDVSNNGILSWYKYYDTTFYKDMNMDAAGDVFVATNNGVIALDAAGGIRWRTGFGNLVPNAITTDPSGNVYVGGTGACTDTTCSIVVAGPSGATTKAYYGKYAVVSLSSNGSFNWATGNRYSYAGGALALAFRNARLHVLGSMSGCSFSPVTDSLLSRTGGGILYTMDAPDFFYAQYDASGNLLQVASSGGNGANTNNFISPGSIFFDDKGNSIIGGNAGLGGGGAIFGNTLTTDGQDAFLLKSNSDLCGWPITPGPAVLDTTGPVILPEKQQVLPGGNLQLTALISDASGVDTLAGQGPALYYKRNSDGDWVKQPGVYQPDSAGNAAWTFVLDLSRVSPVWLTDTIYYFYAAQDLAPVANQSSYPSGDSVPEMNTVTVATHLLTYMLTDVTPPVIAFVPPGNPQLYAPIQFTAGITDDYGVIGSGTRQPRLLIVADSLAVPVIKDTVWGTLTDGDTRRGTWEFDVPSAFTGSLKIGQPFRYFLMTVDSGGNVTTYPNSMACKSYSCDLSGGDNFVHRQVVDTIGPAIRYAGLTIESYGVYRLDSVWINDTTGVDGAVNAPECYYRVGSAGALIKQVGTVYGGGTPTTAMWSFPISLPNSGVSFIPGDTLYYCVVAQDLDPVPNLRSNPAGVAGSSVQDVTSLPTMNYMVIAVSGTTPDASTLLGVDLTIMPNPNSGDFNYRINGPVNAVGQVAVKDFLGRTLYSQKIGMIGTSYNGHISGSFSPGAYFLELTTDTGHAITKFLVR